MKKIINNETYMLVRRPGNRYSCNGCAFQHGRLGCDGAKSDCFYGPTKSGRPDETFIWIPESEATPKDLKRCLVDNCMTPEEILELHDALKPQYGRPTQVPNKSFEDGITEALGMVLRFQTVDETVPEGFRKDFRKEGT